MKKLKIWWDAHTNRHCWYWRVLYSDGLRTRMLGKEEAHSLLRHKGDTVFIDYETVLRRENI